MSWRVQILGNSNDLKRLTRLINSDPLIVEQGQDFFLIDTAYDAINCPMKIAEHASKFINSLQAIASLIEPLNTITVAHVEEIYADGTRTVTGCWTPKFRPLAKVGLCF
jgi:hypothetical protein